MDGRDGRDGKDGRDGQPILLAAFSVYSALTLSSVAPLAAHPGVGIVMDRSGVVYYTDLNHVWRIARDGAKSIAVRSVHTHELFLDAGDTLYGEHLWYEGERTNEWGHYVWRLLPNGVLDTVIPPTEGLLTNYSFVRDAAGTMYWAEPGDPTVIRKRLRDGTIVSLTRAPFRDVRWMTVTPDGTVYLLDDGALVEITPEGRTRTVVPSLREHKVTQVHVAARHNVMGLWTDRSGNVYAAVYGGRLVRRIRPDGQMTVVARSGIGWGPSGGMVAPNGDLWLLEYSFTNRVRVRQIDKDGRATTF